jgi:heat shock protein 4
MMAPLVARLLAPSHLILDNANVYAADFDKFKVVGGDEDVARECSIQFAIVSPAFKVCLAYFNLNRRDLVSRPSRYLQSVTPSTVSWFARRLLILESPFYIKAEYSDRTRELGQPAGICKETELFLVQGLKRYAGKNGETNLPTLDGDQYKATFKIKSRLDGNRILRIDSAYQQEEYMVPVVEENEEAVATEKKEGDFKKEEAAVEQKMESIIRKIESKVSSPIPSLSASEMNSIRQFEGGDKLDLDTSEARNELKEYVYGTRSNLEMEWSEFIDKDLRVEFKETLTAMEVWLYTDEGENAIKTAYVEKLNSLKRMSGSVALRYKAMILRVYFAQINVTN